MHIVSFYFLFLTSYFLFLTSYQMCGIIAYLGQKNAIPILLTGLHHLEYRGYDSCGLTVIENKKAVCHKAVGKISALESKLKKHHIKTNIGLAHTRWATHGKPSTINSHPHYDCTGKIHIVHNGIIENYQKLSTKLQKNHQFVSQTDSEVIAHLIEENLKKNNFKNSVLKTIKQLKGTYGLVILNQDEQDQLIAAKQGSPLILGIGNNEYFIASDISAIIKYTKNIIYLDDGEILILNKNGYEIININNQLIDKNISQVDWDLDTAEKQGYKHFMLKEIMEQPHSLLDTMRGRLDIKEGLAKLGGINDILPNLKNIKKIIIISCGTSYYAGLVGKYMFEEYAGIDTAVEYASEFRYRKTHLDHTVAVLAISQSGETADTLAAIKEAKLKNALTLGIVNVVGATIARETDAGVYNHSGPEIGVASTKAFTSQLTVLALLTVILGRQRDMSLTMGKRIITELSHIPNLVQKTLTQKDNIKKIAKKYFSCHNFLCMGRKYNFPIALEGALKIKEISYIHAEGYPSGEMKHGPIALIDKNFPAIFIAPKDSVYEKNISGMEEIKARGGEIIAITTQGNKNLSQIADDIIFIPKTLEMLTPILSVIPFQFLAYYLGVMKNLDVDKPRNLAKSVTVE